MAFSARIKPTSDESPEGIYFLFAGGRLLIKREENDISIPVYNDIDASGITVLNRQYFGDLDGNPCYAGEVERGVEASEKLELEDLRTLLTRLDEEVVWIAGRAKQLAHWNKTHQFCGACGRATVDKAGERAKMCPHCNITNYPRLSPAVIVAVVRDNEILLARNQRYKIPIYSVLAGFVEPGETLEDCIHREIKEEVGLSVENIRYFGSQPWPFPDSLMIAFTAEYSSGEIEVDLSELIEARWFTKENLPQVPVNISIAGKLIDWFCRR